VRLTREVDVEAAVPSFTIVGGANWAGTGIPGSGP
jgi:hypothetical protein